MISVICESILVRKNTEMENDKNKDIASEKTETDNSENLNNGDSSYEIPFIDPSVYKFKKKRKYIG